MNILNDHMCMECEYIGEFYCDGDSPIICPACRSIDSITEIDPTPYEIIDSYRPPEDWRDEHDPSL